MTRVIGISGSLRRGSYNTALLRAAQHLLPADTELRIESIADIPLYNGDLESEQGSPARVTELKRALAEADGLLVSTPEYNHSIPGVTKNAIDWLSRPPREIPKVFGDFPVAIMGASNGRFGTTLAQTAWLPVIRALGARLWSGRLLVAGAGTLFDEAGNLQDEEMRERLKTFIEGFVAFVRRDPRPPSF